MISKTLLAVATAAAIAAGSLGATTTSASAGGGVYFGGGNWGVGIGFPTYPAYPYPVYDPAPVCKPIFKKVAWWDYYGKKHIKKVYAGQKCFPPLY